MFNKSFVCKLIKDNIWIMINNTPTKSIIKGNIRLNDKLCVGDYVEYEISNGNYLITKIMPRINKLIRPNVANIDLLLIVQSAIEPTFDELFIEKMILFYVSKNIKNIIVGISKIDLLKDKKNIYEVINKYNEIDIKFFDLSNNDSFHKMIELFRNKKVCIVGNSGVGKSTLINRIAPDLKLLTQDISKSLNRGKHTTTYSSIIYINNFYLIDTPGFSTIELNNIDHELLNSYYFYHFKNLLTCKYLNCSHTHERDCNIKNNLDKNDLLKWRYNHYLYIKNNIKNKL